MTNNTVSFNGDVVLITGAGRGLGRSYALLLAARGARVVVNDIGAESDGSNPSAQPAETVAAEIRAAGGEAIANSSDITTEAGAQAAVDAAINHFGRLDAVINNAGLVVKGRFGKMTLADLDQMLSIHVRGTFLITSAAWKVMAGQGHGRIVTTTSCAGLYGEEGLAAYSTAKGALIGLTRALGLDGEALGIRTNAIAPLAYTRMAAGIPDEAHRSFFERNARAEQVAPLVAFLAHRECPVNGQIFDAGAGRFTRVFFAAGRGYVDTDPTMESVRDHFAEVLSEHDYRVPVSGEDTIAQTLKLITPAETGH